MRTLMVNLPQSENAGHPLSRTLLLTFCMIIGVNVLAAEQPQSTQYFKVVVEGPVLLQTLKPLVNLKKEVAPQI